MATIGDPALSSAYPGSVRLPLAVRRLGYRTAYRLLELIWLLRRPGKLGVKCLLVNHDRILLVRHTYGHRDWDLPGGGVKRGELPLSAARREMGEELGIVAGSWTPLGEVRGIVSHRRDTVHCFRVVLPTSELAVDLGELAAAAWFAPSEIPSDLGPYVRPILALVRSPLT